MDFSLKRSLPDDQADDDPACLVLCMTLSWMIQELSAWIDASPANLARDREAATWGRLAKISEECGEVIAAFIGATGQNPRKGVVGDLTDVQNEVLDVALTALCAYEHLTGHEGKAIKALVSHTRNRHHRAGL